MLACHLFRVNWRCWDAAANASDGRERWSNCTTDGRVS